MGPWHGQCVCPGLSWGHAAARPPSGKGPQEIAALLSNVAHGTQKWLPSWSGLHVPTTWEGDACSESDSEPRATETTCLQAMEGLL